MGRTRLLTLDDAPAVAGLVRRDRAYLAPWEPQRAEEWFTLEGQRGDLGLALDRHEQGTALPHVVLDDDGRVVGRITLNGIVRGPLQSCSVGYWVGEQHTGRGLATSAVREILCTAFDGLGLHRVQGETLVHNAPSQRVLERTGFTRYGLAPSYLRIAGRWQDCVMWQVLAPDST